jgi:hypothetical protein
MLKKILLSALIAISSMQLYGAMEAPQMKDIDDIQRLCDYLTNNFFSLCPGDVSACTLLSENVIKVLEDTHAKLTDSWITNPNNLDNYKGGDNGRVKCCLCSPRDVYNAFLKIVKDLKRGWYESAIKENWVLLTKKAVLIDEDRLINLLAFKFGLSESLLCCRWGAWLKDTTDECEYHNSLILWVKKNVFSEFQKKFKFQIKKLIAKQDEEEKGSVVEGGLVSCVMQ